jgi:hypothetical protein
MTMIQRPARQPKRLRPSYGFTLRRRYRNRLIVDDGKRNERTSTNAARAILGKHTKLVRIATTTEPQSNNDSNRRRPAAEIRYAETADDRFRLVENQVRMRVGYTRPKGGIIFFCSRGPGAGRAVNLPPSGNASFRERDSRKKTFFDSLHLQVRRANDAIKVLLWTNLTKEYSETGDIFNDGDHSALLRDKLARVVRDKRMPLS